MTAAADNPAVRWDLYCRVIDNHGDIGVCWRLAADLAARGERVRLRVDDPSALAWMAPDGARGVELRRWDDPPEDPGEVVVELFGCDPPAGCVERMAATARPPVWINLEYLSAEQWVERSHGLRSPVAAGPGRGLQKWFFFPGFTAHTGGLIRETDAIDDDFAGVERDELPPGPEAAASVFCYPNPALPALARDWPGLLRLCPGAAQQALPAGMPGTERLPWLTQPGYDALLRGSALNLVRGEDSLVRAIWAGRPFVWQAYPQHDGVHRAKLDALLDRLIAHAPPGDTDFAPRLRRLWHAWNGFATWPDPTAGPVWPDWSVWRATCRRWRAALGAAPDLVRRLQVFVNERR
ncbi:MAG: elongation factor P maturation arginine rhamnosyltransferase EarP [Rubrivivax sp.]